MNVYQSNPKSKIMLLNEALNRLEFYLEGKIAMIALPKEISLSPDYKNLTVKESLNIFVTLKV